MVEEIKGLEKCIWKYMSNDTESTTFEPVNKKYTGDLWKCKYNCLGYDDTSLCYRPISKYPESKYYKLVIEDYYALKRINNGKV